MCIHRRFIYHCGHDGWGAELSTCRLERAFRDGFWPVGCRDMYAHPIHTLKLQVACKQCDRKAIQAAKTLDKLLQVKLAMAALGDTVRKLKARDPVPAIEDGDGADVRAIIKRMKDDLLS